MGSPSEPLCTSLICLIPKGGDKIVLKNWRPITLLGTAYKILAKTLAFHLRPLLPYIIRATQIGFVHDRSTMFFPFREATHSAPESLQDITLLLLDFENAYDTVDWRFLMGIMGRLGFNDYWISWVSPLNSDSANRMVLCGGKGPTFQLSRSVRQGCPLATYLFLFVVEAMGYFL